MRILLISMAILCTIIGHMMKAKRWGLYISVYESPDERNLLEALACAQTVNAVLPFRLGDAVKVFWTGRKLNNGYSLAIATVISDLYVDFIVAGGFLGIMSYFVRVDELKVVGRFYFIALCIVIPSTVLVFYYRKYVKRLIRHISKLFNTQIEFYILYIAYLIVVCFKDIFHRIKKTRFIFYTCALWICYGGAYYLYAMFLANCGFSINAWGVVATLFSGFNLMTATNEVKLCWAVFLIGPLLACWLLAACIIKKSESPERSNTILPQMNRNDKLAFLETYYEGESREYISTYLQINQDVIVLEDKSAGSNASTVTIMKRDGNLYWRKYAFNEDGVKLRRQIEWIEEHQSDIPLPIVVEKRFGDNFATYDMHSYGSATGLFRYIHTMPIEKSWKILQRALLDIDRGIHQKNVHKADVQIIQQYIQTKIYDNMQAVKKSNRFIRTLEQYRTILVNGVELPTMGAYSQMLSEEHLLKVFENDWYADIHGDLTIENIVCLDDCREVNSREYDGRVFPKNYYFIDPNTGNIHESPFLDYSKLLQSLHGKYEFLMMVSGCSISENQVNYMLVKSDAYEKLYQKYVLFLKEHFSRKQILSIYFHEVVHWFRLMPYKIRKDERLAVVFYTGLLSVLRDVWEMEHAAEK